MNKIKLLIIFSMMVIWNCAANAIDVRVKWRANHEPDLAGYKVYFGLQSKVYDNNIIVNKPDTLIYLHNFEYGKTYYFSLTAFDSTMNESNFSEEVSQLINWTNVIPDSTAPGKVIIIEIKPVKAIDK